MPPTPKQFAIIKGIESLVRDWVLGDAYNGMDEPNDVWYNQETHTFSSGAEGGVKIRPSWIMHWIEQSLKGLNTPLYVYRCKDNASVCIENPLLTQPVDHVDIQRSFKPCDIEGLFIGWD